MVPPSIRVDMKLGFACNNKCRFCVQGNKRDIFENLAAEIVKTRLSEARRFSDEVVFTGGEVTIRKDLPSLVEHAKNIGFRLIQIQTNGRMLAYKGLINELVNAGATEFSPALHGHTAKLHDYLTRSPGSFDQTITGLRNLKARNLPVVTNTVITRSNFRHLEEIALLLIRHGVTQYQFAFVHALGSALENFESIVPRMKLISPHVMKGLEAGRKRDVRCTTEAIPACILPGYEEHMAEWILPDSRIYDGANVLDSYASYRINEGKAKGPDCMSCFYNRTCEGPWREYAEKFGWEEFRPVTNRVKNR